MTDWYPIPVSSPGGLAIVARPRGGDWLADDVQRWRRLGVTTVVSLLTPEEEVELDIGGEKTAVETAGMQFVSHAIDDRGIPADRIRFLAMVDGVRQRIQAGETAAVHCRQGIGRAPLTAIAVLMALGVGIDDAIQTVADARGRPVPETKEQRRWLEDIPVPVCGPPLVQVV